MSWTRALLDGTGQHIAAAGLGTWKPNGIYLPADIALIVGFTPPQPDRVVVIAQYGTVRRQGLATVTVSVQLKSRGASTDSRSAAHRPIRGPRTT